jgi:molybdopterin synthase catalytic subunit
MKFLIDRMKKRVVFDKKHHFSGKYRSWQALSATAFM